MGVEDGRWDIQVALVICDVCWDLVLVFEVVFRPLSSFVYS